jgi:hypothetical protein
VSAAWPLIACRARPIQPWRQMLLHQSARLPLPAHLPTHNLTLIFRRDYLNMPGNFPLTSPSPPDDAKAGRRMPCSPRAGTASHLPAHFLHCLIN